MARTSVNPMRKNAMEPYTSCLSINTIRLAVHLGYTKSERKKSQPVDVDVRLYFSDLPDAFSNDKADFLCYADISSGIKNHAKKKQFRLIEFMAGDIHRLLRNMIDSDIKIWIRVTKCKVPVSIIHGGASFTYSDLSPSAWVLP